MTTHNATTSPTVQPNVVYFVRHGATEYNLQGIRCGGDLDVGLCDLGRDQAMRIAGQIRAMKLDVGVILTSALLRTRETGAIVSEMLGGLPIVIDPLLNERSLGEWNRQSHAATEHLLRSGATPPGGESDQAFTARIDQALEGLVMHLPARPLVVGSSGVGRVVHSLLGGAGRLQLANGEITHFKIERDRHSLTISKEMP